MTFKEIQGNSLWIKIVCETYVVIDPVWANYTGKWNVQDATGAVLCFGDLVRSVDPVLGIFYARLTAAQTRALTVGTHAITFQIYNNVVASGYEEEQHHKLTISAAERIV
jgi:hypothetical protein